MSGEIEYLGNFITVASQFIVNYGFQIIGALIILFLGWQVSKWLAGAVLKLCTRANLDITLSRFFASVTKVLILVFVVIIAMGKFGITIAPFIAALGAVAFGGTLALQGPLSNYGSGLTIILTRPFVIGDTITIQGVTGVVDVIKMAYTQLSNEDGQCITIPNKQIVGEILSNSFAHMLVESVIRISFNEDPERAVSIIRKVIADNADIPKQPQPLIGISKFAESAIEIGLRYWVPSKRYYEIQYAINRDIYRRIKEYGIVIQYPQLDVQITNKRS
jgi:Small-conductance mechanosensitive channel